MAAHLGVRGEQNSSDFEAEKYPREIANNLRAFQDSLTEVEKALAPLKKASLGDVHNKLQTLDRAKLELVSAYAINSMFWMYLCTQGVNPRDHPIKHELGRIQKYMNRVKEIMDKENAAKLDKGAAKRFVKAALYDAAEEKRKGKRKATGDTESGPSKKR
ncbi:nuclear nucleic acid-binding protein C1D-like [Acanthaster planci]|uniref:Nuclear nucleic acid-binding protein C1D n=1 Tax=Acanthaster planci TaxID=133434 RepID=A0A8B7XKX9_ACAPL|nr:nuclear nucleic acid-binding protein C1D-like [Acanthaster planci]